MGILFLIIGVGAVFVVFIYNNLVTAKNNVELGFSSIDVMLKKRYDLIPNLVESVKAYMKYEGDLLTQITSLRSRLESGAINDSEKDAAQNQLTGLMKNVIVASENYPELKTSEQFVMLQRSWNEVEEQISASRRAYNSAVTQYNNSIESFPTNMVASMFGHKRKPLLETPESERKNVNAKTLFGS
jgi:LemA protein